MHTTYFLTPKNEVVWTPEHATLREALARMEQSGHTAIPVLDEQARYVKTLTEGDLLRKLMDAPGPLACRGDEVRIADVPPRRRVHALDIDADFLDLLTRVIDQNFVPVVDNRGVFAGIVRRREILEYCTSLIRGAMARLANRPQ
jgi:CBS domain-containing protein